VRIIPRDRKGDAKTFEWHGVHNTFQSPTALKQKLKETFGIDKLPGNIEDLQIGYIAKRGNGKRWIDQDADLSSMYAQFEQSLSLCFVRYVLTRVRKHLAGNVSVVTQTMRMKLKNLLLS